MIKKIFLGLFCTFLGFSVHAQGNFGDSLEKSISTDGKYEDLVGKGGLQKRLQGKVTTTGEQGVTEFIIFLAIKVLLPIAVLAGLVIAFIGFYKLLTSDKEDELKKGGQYLLWGTIGVVTMVMATFLVGKLVGGDINSYGTQGLFGVGVGAKIFTGKRVAGQQLAEEVYITLIYPFLKLFMYVIIGILFVLLFLNLFQYLFSPADDIQKKALTIIIWNTLGIMTIIFSKYIVEFIFGKYSTVVNPDNFSSGLSIYNSSDSYNLGKIGTPLGEIPINNLSMFYTILNWFLGLLTLIILILIIYEGYKLLVNPTDSGGVASAGKTLGYIFLGILVLGCAYLIASAIIPVA